MIDLLAFFFVGATATCCFGAGEDEEDGVVLFLSFTASFGAGDGDLELFFLSGLLDVGLFDGLFFDELFGSIHRLALSIRRLISCLISSDV